MYDPLSNLLEQISKRGGFVNAHSHLDRSYSVTETDMEFIVKKPLTEKWRLVDDYKSQMSEEDYYHKFCYAIKKQAEFGVQAIVSFVDVDPVVKMRAVRAAQKAKIFASELGVRFFIASQTLKGIITNQSRKVLEECLTEGYLDILGSLPKADQDPERHLDTILAIARAAHLPVHAHVDQNNTASEKETELLARKTIQFGYEGSVTAIHSISLACHPLRYRKMVYGLAKDAGLSFVACPTAWLDHKRNETLVPFHNALTPVDELISEGLVVALGTDNIHDIYKPYCRGDMTTEMRVLLEGCKLYDPKVLLDICTTNGLRITKKGGSFPPPSLDLV